MSLKKNVATILLLCAVTLGLALSGCSSGGSSGSATAPNQSLSTVYGIASLGTTTPGIVSAKDSSVPAQEKTAAISSNGSFTVDVSGLNPPYVLKASSTDNSGTIQMYSVSMTGGRTNINPITNVAINAAANGTTSPDVLYTMPDREMYRRTADDFESIIGKLQTMLAPLFALYQVSGNAVNDDNEDENSGLRAMFRDVRVVGNNGIVTVTNRHDGSVIFSGPLNDLASGIFYPASMPAGPAVSAAASTTCMSFMYSGWGACQSDNTQTRTVASSSPTGCTGGTPVLSQSCIYVSPACTYNYSNWGACLANGTQIRTAQSSPTGCTGTPILSQPCTYGSTCSSFTYNGWGTCTNGTQTRTIATSSPTGCTGGTPVLSQSCTSSSTLTLAQVTTSCTGCHGLTVNGTVFATGGYTVTGRTASAWLTSVNNMIGHGASLTPAGATAQDYANFLAALASAPPATCSSFTYSAWGTCQSNSTQARTVATSSPTGCTGGTPVLSQSCTYVPPVNACASFTYSAWGTCQSNSTQTRTVATSSPAGCTGGSPVLSQACTYTAPNPVTMALVQSTCTQCHGLTVNTTVFKTGGYSVSGRTASAWVTALTGMLTPPAGTTIQNFADFLVTVP